jgi:hypothetical protein
MRGSLIKYEKNNVMKFSGKKNKRSCKVDGKEK